MPAGCYHKGDSVTGKTLAKDPVNLIVTGVGGQGNIVISALIGTALVK